MDPESFSNVLTHPDSRARFDRLCGCLHAQLTARRIDLGRRLGVEHGQGTVEYVGLILLVSLLMVGMVAAMQNFQSDEGSAIADTIVRKMKSAINKITFR